MTPEQLASWCAQHHDVDGGAELVRLLNEKRLNMPTILSSFSYVLAELERSAPQPGLVIPTLALMTERCAAAFDHPAMQILRRPSAGNA